MVCVKLLCCVGYVTPCLSLSFQHDTWYLVKPKRSCHHHRSVVFHMFEYLWSSAVTLKTDCVDSMRTPVIKRAFYCLCVCRLDRMFSSLHCVVKMHTNTHRHTQTHTALRYEHGYIVCARFLQVKEMKALCNPTQPCDLDKGGLLRSKPVIHTKMLSVFGKAEKWKSKYCCNSWDGAGWLESTVQVTDRCISPSPQQILSNGLSFHWNFSLAFPKPFPDAKRLACLAN